MDSLDAVSKNKMDIALQAISRHTRPVAAYLFGSHIDGTADQWSDYDLAVFVEGTENWSMTSLARLCATIQKEAGDDIELHFFPADQAFAPEPASFAAFVIKHGIRLMPQDRAA